MRIRKADGAGEKPTVPLLLLPGTLCDERLFRPLLERLPGIRTNVVLRPDACSLREAAGAVLAAAPARFALLGFSLGGLVAMETALLAPGRVQALALLSTTPLPVPFEQHTARRAVVAAAYRAGPARVLREQMWPGYAGTEGNSASLALLEAMADALGPAVFERQTEMALAREDMRPRLHGITCPTLILAGDQDRLCPPAVQQELAGSLAAGTLTLLPGAGHLALLEQPDEVASAVAAWFTHPSQAPRTQRGTPLQKEEIR